MQTETWLLYFFAIVLIGISPGPIAMLSMSHGIHFGKKRSIATGLGSVSAALILMAASAAGLGAIISASEYGFTILKWCGAAYLVFLGIKLLLTKQQGQTLEVVKTEGKGTPKQLFKQAFLVGISNPKDLLFFAALFPQFIDLTAPQLPQLTILALTWALVDFSFVMIYASMANVLAPSLKASNKLHWFDRTSGGVFLTLAAILVSRD
ncbi:LysE family translocator [Shewanella oneidensis MR-1]|uniref:LysE family translocator n=1 Tax=Shewanella oneidensis TaxID=70863 RepID=UPI001562D998|nr:LysE family translocator [Shewanella oneidensis]MDX5997897.1 LysE family translocator [Shewanella oneidensis]MEE2026955.1 Homoserine/homoserine lactone efflux protein [Shewanella oneidensis]QKG95095.1 LysE family translocator [Shewanella oneidensis MR-1]